MWFDIYMLNQTERLESKSFGNALNKFIKTNKKRILNFINRKFENTKILYFNIQPTENRKYKINANDEEVYSIVVHLKHVNDIKSTYNVYVKIKQLSTKE